MKRLLKAELFILLKSRTYQCLLIACCLFVLKSKEKSYFGVTYETGYEWFCVRQLMGSKFHTLVCIFAADYVASGFSNRTIASGICCGFTRKEVFGAKMIAYMMGLVPLFLVNTAVGTVSRTIKNGFGTNLNSAVLVRMATSYGYHILTWMLVYGMFQFMWAVITKSRTKTIIFSMGTMQIIGSLTARAGEITGKMEDSAAKVIYQSVLKFNPLYQLHTLLRPQVFIRIPFSQFAISAFACFLGITYISMHVFERSDLR